jgi:hypothetical protein
VGESRGLVRPRRRRISAYDYVKERIASPKIWPDIDLSSLDEWDMSALEKLVTFENLP